jgi:hypothetical protein
MNSINELIYELIKLRNKHGNIEIKYNNIQLEVIGISHKYLLIKSELSIVRQDLNSDQIDG